MKHLYFVRHAQSDHTWGDDETRPLTATGQADTAHVLKTLRPLPINGFVSSPYIRSVDTLRSTAGHFGQEIDVDARLRERQSGPGGNEAEMLQKRWADFDFCEPGGEPLGAVRRRNVAAVAEILRLPGAHIVVGTHGTALSTILQHYDPAFGLDDFLRILDYLPYIARLDFDGTACKGKQELLIIERPYSADSSLSRLKAARSAST